MTSLRTLSCAIRPSKYIYINLSSLVCSHIEDSTRLRFRGGGLSTLQRRASDSKTWNKAPDSLELVSKNRFGQGTNIYLYLHSIVAVDNLDGAFYDQDL